MFEAREETRSRSGGGVALGFVAGAVIAALAGYAITQKTKADVRRGWNLVPVVVVAQDIRPGTALTVDLIAQRSIPEQFMTSSYVTPASVQDVDGAKTTVELRAGDLLRWSDVGKPTPPRQ